MSLEKVGKNFNRLSLIDVL